MELAIIGITELLHKHDFTKYGDQYPDFTTEFAFVEEKVPDERSSRIRIIITAVMAYAVGGTFGM